MTRTPITPAPARYSSFRRSRARSLLATLAALAVAACAADDGGDTADADVAATDTSAEEARVPSMPTADDALPPAIVGDGGELLGRDLSYFEADPASRGYVAVPEGAGPFPALVIVHEWNGLTDRVRQLADDLAAEGYVTLAVDLFSGQTGSNPDENRALVQAVNDDPETMIANMDAAVAWLKARPDVTGRVGAMGWCFGGGIALSYGLDGAEHEATAIFYGRLLDDPERLAALDHEVYGTFAEMDAGIPPESVEAFEAALREAGVESDVHVYDAVDHGFWLRVDQEPEVRTEPALDAWQRLKAYLDRTLGGA